MADPTFPTDLPTDLSDRPPDRPGELQTRASHPQIPADFGTPPANKNPSCHVKKMALCGDGGVSYIPFELEIPPNELIPPKQPTPPDGT